MAGITHDGSTANRMRGKSLPPGGKQSVFLTNRSVVFDVGKIDDELRSDGADLSAIINP